VRHPSSFRPITGLLCGLAVVVAGAGAARANQCVWVGGGGNGSGGRFSRASNWSCTGGATRATTDDYFFDPTMTVNSKTGANTSCTFDNNGGDITANSVTIRNTYTSTLNGNSTNIAVTITSAWTQSTGTFSGAAGDLTVGSLSLTGGAFTANTGTTSIDGSFSRSGTATFDASTGTVALTGAGATVTGASGTNDFNLLSVSGSYTLGSDLAVASNLTLTGTLATSTFGLSVKGAMSQTAGTFTGGAGTVGITGALAISGTGSFTASTGTTSVGGSFTFTGASFNANGGTLLLTGSGSLSPGGSTSLNALTVGASGTYTLGSALLVTSNLTITAGTLKDAGFATSVGGNWSNSGTFTSTGTVTLTGSGTVAGATGSSKFYALSISGSYTMSTTDLATASDLTLTGTLATNGLNLSVGGSLNQSAGTLTGGAGTVGITSNLTMTGGTYTGGSGSATVGGNVNVSATATSSSDSTLVGYWSFDDTNHNLDSSSYASTGSTLGWTGTTSSNFTSDKPSSITFTDTTSVNLTNGNNPTTATQYGKTASALSSLSQLRPATLTLSAWYKATSTDSVASEIVSGSNSYALRITSYGLVVMKRIAASQWIEYQVPFSGVLDGNWHQVVGVIDPADGYMAAYLDGVVATGTYAVGGTTTPLTSTSNPTASAAASAAIDLTDTGTASNPLTIGYNPQAAGYNFGATSYVGSTGTKCSGTNLCEIDDVRVYNRALSAADVAALSHGSQPVSSASVLALSGSMTVNGTMTIQSTGTLTLTGGSLALGTASAGSTLIIDGVFNSTGGAIAAVSASKPYTFEVGSTKGSTPNLNINGLTVANTDSHGMWVNVYTSTPGAALTTFTEFDKVAFSSGTGTSTALLNINASTLYLSSNGCTFDNSTTYAVMLTSTAATGATGPRALFGNATCNSSSCTGTKKKDDDSDGDGVPTPTNGAVVQFIRAAESDTDGTMVGFPTAAFDWSSFSWYSTYAAFHDASGGSDVIYVRDESGAPLYSWTDTTTSETIVGTPAWTTSGGNHYLYVAVNGSSANTGKVYRLLDTLGTKLAVDGNWKAASGGAVAGVYSCTCTITSGLQLDNNNVYWAASNASGQRVFGIKQADGTSPSTTSGAWPFTVPATVTTSAPTLVIAGTTSSLFLGATSALVEIADTTKLTWLQDDPGGITTITGRVSYGTSFLAATSGTKRIYVGDSSGAIWSVSPSAFSGSATSYLWTYKPTLTPVIGTVTDNYYDATTDTVQYGTSGGYVVSLNAAGNGSSGGSPVNSSYPYQLPNSDSVSTAPLYYGGVLVVGSSNGNLYFLDRNTGSTTAPNGVKILKEVNFGPSESVSSIGFDSTYSRYMVSTSSAANDGRIYYFDLVSDTNSPSYQ
jgi:fibronectin-binding autotransporter adhesin